MTASKSKSRTVPDPAPALTVPLPRARAFWLRRRGLGASVQGPLDDRVAATGWVRTLGGAEAYLALRARVPGLRREAVDQAVLAPTIQVVPAVRGCMYLLPRRDVPLALRVAADLSRPRTDRELAKVSVPWSEIEAAARAIAAALGARSLTTDALRAALPAGAVRSLGEAGKKIGMSSTLPVALREAEFQGLIERTPTAGRLDTERYEWRAARPADAAAHVPADPFDRSAALARRFLAHAGPATVRDLAGWSGLAQRDAAAALQRLPVVPVQIEGLAETSYLLADDKAALGDAHPADAITLLGFEDNYLALHGGVALFCDPAHHGRSVPSWGRTEPTTLGEARHLSLRTIFDGDRLAGFWEYDPDRREVVTGLLSPLSPSARRELDAQAAAVSAFLRDEIGHGRSFSLDTDDALRERSRSIEAI